MSVFKRNATYYFEFVHCGKRYVRSTKVKNQRAAEEIERAFRTALAKGDVGIVERKAVPTFEEFAPRFLEAIRVRSHDRPATVKFYTQRTGQLLKCAALRNAKLSDIDEALIDRYVAGRRTARIDGRKAVSPACCNRELATLRRALRLAEEWKVIVRAPRIRLLKGEKSRTFVLSHAQESEYLNACPPDLRDAASIMLDTGLRIGELVNLRWEDIRFQPVGSARFGSLKVHAGKSQNAVRAVSLTSRASAVLFARRKGSGSPYVFPGDTAEAPMLVTSFDHLHRKVCEPIVNGKKVVRFPREFVLHGLRHTFLTRLGEAGADAFTIMRLAGHSSVTVSQRYVHPTPESCELAFERLEALNGRGREALEGEQSQQTSQQRKRKNA